MECRTGVSWSGRIGRRRRVGSEREGARPGGEVDRFKAIEAARASPRRRPRERFQGRRRRAEGIRARFSGTFADVGSEGNGSSAGSFREFRQARSQGRRGDWRGFGRGRARFQRRSQRRFERRGGAGRSGVRGDIGIFGMKAAAASFLFDGEQPDLSSTEMPFPSFVDKKRLIHLLRQRRVR
jgi:hypothetical protein